MLSTLRRNVGAIPTLKPTVPLFPHVRQLQMVDVTVVLLSDVQLMGRLYYVVISHLDFGNKNYRHKILLENVLLLLMPKYLKS